MPKALRGPPEERGITGGVGCREKQQLLRRLGQGSYSARVVLVQRPERAVRVGSAEAAGQLGLAHRSRQLEQPQRVPGGLCHDPVANPLVEVTRHGGCNQRPRVFLGEPLERQARQGGKQLLLAGLPDREQQQDRLSQEAPAYESKDLA